MTQTGLVAGGRLTDAISLGVPLARTLYPHLEDDWLLIADRNFCNGQDWCTAADSGAVQRWEHETGNAQLK